MHRRKFLKTGAVAVAGCALSTRSGVWAAEDRGATPLFTTSNQRWQATYDKALSILAGNVQVLPRYDKPVLIEGAAYAGIWQECGPLEALVYRLFRPDVARNSQMVFFALQRANGQLPANNKRTETGFGQIQMVVPIAATAWELANATGDSELLESAYDACSRWDAWLLRYRNTRQTGLIEGFCTYDTGMDNSPRWAGIPPQCPQKNAELYPPIPTLPRLCPDLSATVYGARVALKAMASALGKRNQSDQWLDKAEKIRALILQRLYVPEDACFYDLDAQNHFVKVRCAILSRVCGEHVVDQPTFEQMWTRQLGNAAAFWAPYPLPSVALNDPQFVRPIPRNSWGGASQALTALRAGRWMDHYGRSAEFAHMMEQWCEALQRSMNFRQQLDPVTGEFTLADQPNYSPAALVMYEYTWRLAGVREEPTGLQWNVRPGVAAARGAYFRLPLRHGSAEMRYSQGGATLTLNGRRIGTVQGTARLETDLEGKPVSLIGVSMETQHVQLELAGYAQKRLGIKPNQSVNLSDTLRQLQS